MSHRPCSVVASSPSPKSARQRWPLSRFACLIAAGALLVANVSAFAQAPPRTKPAAGPGMTPGAKPKPSEAMEDNPGDEPAGKPGDKPADAPRKPLTVAEKALLNAIRTGLANRDLPAAAKAIEAAKEYEGSESYDVDLERLQLLNDYVTQFWKGADRGMRTLQALDELEIGDSKAAVVEVTADGVLILRVAGANKQRTLKDMPPKLAVTLALRALDVNDPVIRVVIGAFWAMDGQAPDQAAAKRLWSEASAKGVDVSDLLPELGAEGAAVVALPKLGPAEKQTLAPANWQVRSGTGDRVKRVEIGSFGQQTNDGRLELMLNEDGGQVVAKKRLAGDFRARAILANVAEGQMFGLYSSSSKDGSWVVALPAGTVQVEFARKGEKFTANVNGEEVEVTTPDGAGERMAGQVGVAIPANGACTIAAFDLR